MKLPDIIKQVDQIVREVLFISDLIDPEEKLMGLGLDSMRTMQMLVKLEVYFNIEFDDNELLIENFNTIESIAGRINSKISGIVLQYP
jgi:acyl carrier protein